MATEGENKKDKLALFVGSREAAGTSDLICCCSLHLFKPKRNINHEIAQIFTWAQQQGFNFRA